MVQIGELTPSLVEAWAKLGTDGDSLPLVDHAADVAGVFASLCREAWSSRLRHCAGRALARADIDRLVVLAYLHDLGKCNGGFQARWSPAAARVGHTGETAALFFAPAIVAHPVGKRLRDTIERWGAGDLFVAAMAHHGRPLEAYAGDDSNPELGRAVRERLRVDGHAAGHWLPREGYDPMQQLGRLLDASRESFPMAFGEGPVLPDSPSFVSLFCGLLTLADWLGSDERLFPVAGPHGLGRVRWRQDAVHRAVVGRGLGGLPTPACDFASAFAVPRARGLQGDAGRDDLGPVALVEAETGSGKTEAALWRWLSLRRAGAVDGLYFALPTRSAAVQLHGRVQTMLERVFGPAAVEAVLAVPGYLRAGAADGEALPEFAVLWSDEGAADGRWAAERPKRFLAARVAVGTIDQVLMAGLQRRHAHLRAAALSRSLLVVDEVHASDAFMGEVLAQVLANHRALGGHALLLSATLAGEARERLLGRSRASKPASFETACAVPYPVLWGATGVAVAGERSGDAKAVVLEAWPAIDDAVAIARRAIEAARAGASVLVVRNSVSGAVAAARAVEQLAPEMAFLIAGVSTAHHGRFAPEDRRLLDAAVEAAFGKGRSAGGRVLCGTQTLEQSLDIDADLLVTDLAPADVLLQRIGRLHRHARADRGAFAQARAVVLVPERRDLSAYLGRVRDRHGLGPAGRDGTGVYPDLLVLEATWRLIEANSSINLPEDNRALVEGALHPDVREALRLDMAASWANHAHAQDGSAMAERGLARRWSLNLARPFGSLLFPDQDEAVATRLGARDRMVAFDPPFDGPFGREVGRLTIPAWMAGGTSPDVVPIAEGRDEGCVVFKLEDRRFRYGRWGLELANQ